MAHMENESLEIFLRRKNAESESKRKAIDWEGRKQQWLAWVDKLYGENQRLVKSLKA